LQAEVDEINEKIKNLEELTVNQTLIMMAIYYNYFPNLLKLTILFEIIQK